MDHTTRNPKYVGMTTYQLAVLIQELKLEIVSVQHEMRQRFADELKVEKLKPTAPELVQKRVVRISDTPKRTRSRLIDLLRTP